MKKITHLSTILTLFLLSFITRSEAQIGTANGTYHFGALGRNNSGGAGFKKQQDKFKVSNVFTQDGTAMYANNAEPGESETVVIKAEGGTINKNFTFGDLALRNYSLSTELDVFTITLRNYFGTVIGSHQLAANQMLTLGVTNISAFNFTVPFPAGGYPGVAEIEIEFHYANASVSPDELTFNSITVSNISSFVLPVTLVNFVVKKENSGVRINWSTADEKDVDRLVLEHSSDGRQFSSIAEFTVPKRSSELTSYTFYHSDPSSGRNYYRLKEIALGGEEKTFVIRSIEIKKAGFSIVGANPLDGFVIVKALPAGRYTVNLTDMGGRNVYAGTISQTGSSDYRLALPGAVQKGTYVLTVQGESGKASAKLVKQ